MVNLSGPIAGLPVVLMVKHGIKMARSGQSGLCMVLGKGRVKDAIGADGGHKPFFFKCFYMSSPDCIHLTNRAISALNCLALSILIP